MPGRGSALRPPQPEAPTNHADATSVVADDTTAPGDDDHYGDMRAIIEAERDWRYRVSDTDLAGFVPTADRHRSMSVVRDPDDPDLIADVARYVDALNDDPAATPPCRAMRTIVERWCDGSRDSQLRGAVAVIRADEQGHTGVAAALDELQGVRSKDPRDFRRLIEFGRAVVLKSPSRPEDRGCRCTRPTADGAGGAGDGGAGPGGPGGPDSGPGERTPDDGAGADTDFAREVARELQRRAVRRAADATERPPLPPPASTSLRALLAEPPADEKYRVEQLWPAGGKVLVTAPRKSGKTTLVGNLVRCLADGDRFLAPPRDPAGWITDAGFRVARPDGRRIVLLDFEMSRAMLREWLADQRIVNVDAVHVETMRGRGWDPRDDTQRAAWSSYLRSLDCGTLIIDPIGPIIHALGIDENSNSEVGRFLTALDRLVCDAGVDELAAVHHAGHGENQRARGASAFLGWGDATWALSRDGDGRFLSAEGRDVWLPETAVVFDRDTRRLSIGEGTRAAARDDRLNTAVLDAVLADPGASLRALRVAVGRSAGVGSPAAKDAIDAAESDGAIHVHEGPNRARLHYPTSCVDGCPGLSAAPP